MKTNALPKWSPAPSRPRCQGRVVFAFTEAQRTPLTEEAGGLGAVFSQEGQRGKKTARLVTYRRQLWFCESVKTGADEALQERVLFQERRSARGAKRGKRFNSSSENGSFKHLMSTAFGAHCTNGSNASRNIAAYFFRS